jgi:DNA recombination protein RmuC
VTAFVTTVLLAVGAAAGIFVYWLLQRGTSQERISTLQSDVASLRSDKEKLGGQIEMLNRQLGNESASRAAFEERATRLPMLEGELEALNVRLAMGREETQKLREENARLATTLAAEKQQAEEKLKLLLEAKTALAEQFQNLANRIFEEKGQKFAQQNIASLDSLLKPLGERLKEFQVRVEETYDKESKQRFSLQSEIQKLVELNTQIGEDAVNLTNALKGSSRVQGSWGELVLERILEASGLQKGREYDLQVTMNREDGTKGRPDVLIRLPENKHVVIDSKVSLSAYDAYCSAQDAAEKSVHLAAHLESVRAHVARLGEQNYQTMYGIRTLDFVLMFVPIEPAFILAAEEDHELFVDAMNRNVMIVSPTTLLISLRTIASIWRYEYQNRNTQELARQCAALYDKFVGFVGDLEEVGKKIDAAHRSFDDARSKLATGKGNLIRQVERIRELGVKPSKTLPPHLTEVAMESAEDVVKALKAD